MVHMGWYNGTYGVVQWYIWGGTMVHMGWYSGTYGVVQWYIYNGTMVHIQRYMMHIDRTTWYIHPISNAHINNAILHCWYISIIVATVADWVLSLESLVVSVVFRVVRTRVWVLAMSVASGKTKGSRTECPDVPSDLNLGALYKGHRCRFCGVWSFGLCAWDTRDTVLSAWWPVWPWQRGSKLKPSGEVCKVCAVVSCLCLCKCCFLLYGVCILYFYIISEHWTTI